jgi:hypothetical protein
MSNFWQSQRSPEYLPRCTTPGYPTPYLVVDRESILSTWNGKRGVAPPVIDLPGGNEHPCGHCPVISGLALAARISLTAILYLDYLGGNLFYCVRAKLCIACEALAEERET